LKRELAVQLLHSILPDPPWTEDRLRQTLEDLRVLAEQKYNKYEMYQPARLFYENLYLFLLQFKKEDRTAALEFVRSDLIFISRDEFQQLAHVLYYDGIRQAQLDLAAKATGIPRFGIRRLVESAEFKRIQRSSLYVALSDGARIDYFRRQNLDINNEQVLAVYYVGDEKVRDVRRDLRNALGDSEAKFECLFLLDDFFGSGRTLLREIVTVSAPAELSKVDIPDGLKGRLSFDEEKHQFVWNYGGPIGGQQAALLDALATTAGVTEALRAIRERCSNRDTELKGALQKMIGSELIRSVRDDAAVYLAPLLATEYGVGRLHELVPRLKAPLNRLEIIPAALVPNKLRVVPGSGPVASLCEAYYDPKIGDVHTSDVKYGYDSCGLPLVLHHNTPNNSLFFLWARKWGNPLFPRFERHGRERQQ
jgi:hypothetical protein